MNTPLVDSSFALLLVDDALARRPLEDAWQQAHSGGDETTQALLSAAALLSMGVEFADFRVLRRWIDRFNVARTSMAQVERDIDRGRIDAALVLQAALDHAWAYDSPSASGAADRLLNTLRAGTWPPGDEGAL